MCLIAVGSSGPQPKFHTARQRSPSLPSVSSIFYSLQSAHVWQPLLKTAASSNPRFEAASQIVIYLFILAIGEFILNSNPRVWLCFFREGAFVDAGN